MQNCPKIPIARLAVKAFQSTKNEQQVNARVESELNSLEKKNLITFQDFGDRLRPVIYIWCDGLQASEPAWKIQLKLAVDNLFVWKKFPIHSIEEEMSKFSFSWSETEVYKQPNERTAIQILI